MGEIGTAFGVWLQEVSQRDTRAAPADHRYPNKTSHRSRHQS